MKVFENESIFLTLILHYIIGKKYCMHRYENI